MAEIEKITREDVLTNARWAGQVVRYHTWQVHRQQSIGEHTWQCMRIYWQIWGPMQPHISTYLLWHDAGELATGDIPFPVKQNNPTLKSIFDDLDKKALSAMDAGGATNHPELEKVDFIRMRACDLIEMWEFGLAELSMGNLLAQPIVDDILVSLQRLGSFLSQSDNELVADYMRRVKGQYPCA